MINKEGKEATKDFTLLREENKDMEITKKS
jgi:hypothetical protein